MVRWCLTAFAMVSLAVAGIAAQPAPREVRLLVGSQQVLEPGFAVGDIAVGDPDVADFQVRPGRRSILLLAKGEGQTKLIVWDQAAKTRSEFELIVETREQAQAEAKLRVLLRDFPSVKLERVGGDLVVTGSVSSEDDLALIERMASSTGAESFVRFVAPDSPAGPATPAAAPTRGDPADPPPATGGDAAVAADPAAPEIEYDIQLLEASIAFGSGSFETGIEPSGRVLHSAKIRARIGREAQAFIPGKALASRDVKIPAAEMETSGIRLTLTPASLEDGQLSTRILVETNMPVKSSAYVPGGWRRARWQSDNAVSAPFSVAGADLLVVPELSSGGGTLSSVVGAAGTVSGLPGVSSLPGAGYAGSASYIPYYNRDRKTHLLVLVRSRALSAR
jgi:hypothetical protein